MIVSPKFSEAIKRHLAPLLDPAGARLLPDLPTSAGAFLAWGLRDLADCSILWITDGPRTLESLLHDLQTLMPHGAPPPLVFPSWEVVPAQNRPPGAVTVGARLATLAALCAPACGSRVIATCIQALMEVTLTPAALRSGTRTLLPHQALDQAALMEYLVAQGYRIVPEVQAPGEAAVRGGIVDIWPLTEAWPCRCEFYGAVVESLRTFDPLDQRSRGPCTGYLLTPAAEWDCAQSADGPPATLLDYALPQAKIVVWADPSAVLAHAAVYATALSESHAARTVAPASIVARLAIAPHRLTLGSRLPGDECTPEADPDFRPVYAMMPAESTLKALPPDLLEAARTRLLDDLSRRQQAGEFVSLWFDTTGGLERFHELYPAGTPAATLPTALGALSGGFACPALRLNIAAESDLYGRRLRRRSPLQPHGAAAAVAGARVQDWTDMEPGQYVVHIEHGIGRYLGLQEMDLNGTPQEALLVEYAGEARLYVPVSQAHLLTRYVGVGRHAVTLHALGGKRWEHEKSAATRAVEDLAGGLLQTQAARAASAGFAFPTDHAWQHEMEAAFPYQTTQDQDQALHDVKADMQNLRPMERLLCGDAGYGKTEIAVRAAFKAVMAGKQVAVLVPTTVLAQQHFQTFRDRLGAFPVVVEALCRFNTGAEHCRILDRLREGAVDIVIGTHALLQPGVAFRDLGLVIVDEEQRFGVAHKERFKQRHPMVDVLTLTATPIPRTLYMSLTGARDLSTIQTPPRERLTVETIVAPSQDRTIREAILRELNREGQVFFLHNRVATIALVQSRLRELVPEASIEVAHGQMSAGQLSEIVQAFAQGQFDVLLCTTIIESGIDIPNANTILIDRADRFGLADLYQLRGRVGRSRHQAYAYMLLPEHAHVDPTARKRMQAIRDYSGAGAGFRLAMRDLEIRGAGNLLGAAQSGHITAVGFGLYCQLLRRAVALAKGETPPPVIDVEVRLDDLSLSPTPSDDSAAAFMPSHYIEDERLRVSIYRRIAEAAFVHEVQGLLKELHDRFGVPPIEVTRLLSLAEIRIRAAGHGVTSVVVEQTKLMLRRGADFVMSADGRFPRLRAATPDQRLEEILRHLRRSRLSS
ncbi:MAG: transcription-repair coupling factor [bacterium]